MRDKDKGLNRRDFIKRTAAGIGLVAAGLSPFIFLANRAKAADDVTDEGQDRHWCMVIDLKKCDGCVGLGIPPQCTQSCIMGHFVPKGMQWIQVFKAELPGGGTYFLPAPCYHCENAPCVNVCPVAATYHIDNGIVLIDQRRCIGCRMCMAACPYHRRFFNWGTPELPPEAYAIEYSPEHQVPAMKGTVMKCDFCPDMIHNGAPPYCVTACPRKVLYMGDLEEDIASNGVEVVKLSKFLDDNDAYRFQEELGTMPRVWYLPGHGQDVGRKPDDPRELKPPEWPWGGEGYDRRPGIWPWGKNL